MENLIEKDPDAAKDLKNLQEIHDFAQHLLKIHAEEQSVAFSAARRTNENSNYDGIEANLFPTHPATEPREEAKQASLGANSVTKDSMEGLPPNHHMKYYA